MAAPIFFLAICHFKLYHFEKAETYFLKQKEILSKTTGEKDKSFAACLINLGALYRSMGKYQQSEAQYIQANEINKILLGENNPDYATSLNNLASLYDFIGQFAKAEQLFTQSGNILKRAVGENSALYATSLNNLGTLYINMGLYEKAKPILTRVLETRKNILGENHPDYAVSLNNLAVMNVSLGNYGEAEAFYIRANEILKKSLGENNPDYAVSLDNLSNFYKVSGRYEKAERLCIESGNIRKKTLGENHPDYATSLSNLAGLYVLAGQYEKGEKLYIQAQEIIRKSFGENHPDYAISLNNLASLYETMGQYKKSEPLYLESIVIRKKVLGEAHTGFATSLNNLGLLYFSIGQYEKAEPLFSRSVEIIKAALGENNPDYATSLNNLSNAWQSMERYPKAEAGFTRVLEIYKKIFGTDHTDYALGLNNLASLYTVMGQYKKAEPLIVQAKDIWKKSMGGKNPAYATGLNNLAAFYRKSQTQYPRAEALYLEAIGLRKTILGAMHPFYSESQNDLGLLYMQMGQYKKAEPLFLSSSNILLQNMTGTFSILSEKEKGKFLDYNRDLIECNNSFLYNYPNASDAIKENNYNLELGLKSLSLADTRNMLELIRNSKDTTVKRIFMQWMTDKNILAKQYSLSAAARSADLKMIETEAESLEKELNRRSSAFNQQQKALRVTMQDVQKNLEEGEAAIEFVKFKLYNKKWTDSVIYAAYVLRKNDVAPQFVPLCEKKQLQQLFDSAGNTASMLVKSFYRGLDVKSKGSLPGTRLYKLIWEPLEPFLKGIKKISYSPAGKLYGVAFHALLVDSTTILMDKYQLQQYTSTRQISLRSKTNSTVKPGGIVLFGDAQFTMDSLQLVKQRKKNNNVEVGSASDYISKTRGNEAGIWISLPGTADEIKKIGLLFEQNKISTRSFVQESASEENLKALTGKSPPIIHIATHGFFLPEISKKKSPEDNRGNAYSLAEDPLLRSGLVLAGGNYAWSGKTPVGGVEDGIATAYEISQLNFSNTELLVLSACETALGDIKGSEGVYGLQRGFKMSGIKKMIVSLWQVPDKETAELMTIFYSYWMKGKTIEEAFYQAQGEMRKKYAPFYWAAFVLVE
ncbi:MAG: CHAT domain-containing protein [Chitinophagaceae bacterium]|nr:CHAT domain-containing protein [Chitinophagaceae bacterium]